MVVFGGEMGGMVGNEGRVLDESFLCFANRGNDVQCNLLLVFSIISISLRSRWHWVVQEA